MRIFVGPTEIAGIGEGLRRGFIELGHQCEVVTAAPHPFRYGEEESGSSITKAWQNVNKLIALSSKPRISKLHLYVLRFLLSWSVFIISLTRFSGYIFLYGLTLTNTEFELRLLKFFGKKIIFCYVGSDARPPYMDGGKFQPPFKSEDVQRVFKETQRVSRLLARHEKYADQIVTSPTIAQFNKRPLVNWFEIGIPRLVWNESAAAPTAIIDRTSKIRALHCPSNTDAKGSAIIEQAVARLNSRGVDIELIMLKGMPNKLILDEIAKSDFVIDQVYSDQPLATFATEAAHLGKPAVVSGYFAETIGTYVRPALIGPSEFVSPESLELAIEKLATDPEYRAELGQKAKQFVEREWSPRCVAARYLRLLSGDTPPEWYFSPQDTQYVEGAGFSRRTASALIYGLVEAHGSSSLNVDDKPKLKLALLSLAEQSKDGSGNLDSGISGFCA